MKIRLDQYIFEQGYAPSKTRAQALIMSGIVFVNNQKADKAGTMIKETDIVEVRGKDLKYVSRGGLKLEKAINEYGLDLTDRVCMDIGASTGGFTDCMLQNGAQKVYAVDVGYGQLAWKLRSDERVKNMEKTNIRNVTVDMLDEKINFFSVDVSFISLKHIFPVAYAISTDDVIGACLVKPQFEAGREKVGKKGVVRDSAVHKEVIENVIGYANEFGFYVHNLTFSPIKGPEGNIEFLIIISKDSEKATVTQQDIDEVVLRAKEHLGE
ncbi:MAG: TlyA family RNA methyltransferase [Oscillospiraceae bacterium]|nr:TlyA family RNA methyltransferase [Oscillospiraceae bacterium]